jgi:4-hydroxy-3-polyprenylbenzoate decarboxylase
MIMPYTALGEFLAELQDNGELVRIAASVDSSLEIAAITSRVATSSPSGGPALLFENVKNSTIPVVTNLLGSRGRICRSLGVARLDDLAADLDRRYQTEPPGGWLDVLKPGLGGTGLNRWAPKSVKTAACQQVVRLGRDINLWDLPVPRSWPDEQYPVITAGHMTTRHPRTGACHLFHSPLVVTGPQELGWYDGQHEQTAILEAARTAQQHLPVAISLGGDPSSSLPITMPGTGDAWLLAGFLRGASLELVRCRTNELEVPAGSEIIIEGYIDTAQPLSSEPLSVARGNGRYLRRPLPLIHVTAITHRANPILTAMITGSPPGEESWIELAGERIMLPLLKRLIPGIVDLHQPFCSAGRNLLFVSIHKTVAHQARRVLHALWGMERLGQTKMIVVVDDDLDLQSQDQIWLTVGTHACPSRDFVFSDGLARDDDYTSLSPSLGSRVGIDATRKQSGETSQPWPRPLIAPDDILRRITERWTEYGLDGPGPVR